MKLPPSACRALDEWLSLERPMTSLPNLELMRADLRLPVADSLHGRKTAGHVSKAHFLTMQGINCSGQESLYLLAKATNIWGKLVAGFVIIPRYLLSGSQGDFWTSITAASSDLTPDAQAIAERSIADFDGSEEALHALFTEARQKSANAMELLHNAAVSGEGYENLMPEFASSQQCFYGLALGCLAAQYQISSEDINACGIMEPGRDADSNKILSIPELTAI